MEATPTPFGWTVARLMVDRKVATVEDLPLSEEAELVLLEHLRGENTTLQQDVVREIADALGIDWRGGSQESRELSTAACWYLFVPYVQGTAGNRKAMKEAEIGER